MERKLAENDGRKGEWRDRGIFCLLRDLRIECNELAEAVQSLMAAAEDDHLAPELTVGYRQDVLDEAADVALYAMFLCDRLGLLPRTEDRGRRYVERPTAIMARFDTREVW